MWYESYEWIFSIACLGSVAMFWLFAAAFCLLLYMERGITAFIGPDPNDPRR